MPQLWKHEVDKLSQRVWHAWRQQIESVRGGVDESLFDVISDVFGGPFDHPVRLGGRRSEGRLAQRHLAVPRIFQPPLPVCTSGARCDLWHWRIEWMVGQVYTD